MTAEQQKRDFQLWDFQPSLGGLMLLRSFGAPSKTANLDIVFYGVNYMEIAPYLRGVQFVVPDNASLARVSEKFGPAFLGHTTVLYKLISEGRSYLVAANRVHVYENHLDFGESPLQMIISRRPDELGVLVASDFVYE